MDQAEIDRLQSYLRRLLGAQGLSIRAQGAEEADVLVGSQKVADLSRDEDEGELSYFFNMGVARAKGAARNAPLDESERVRLQQLLREKLGAPKLEVRPRPRKTDSAEVYVADEFIGTLSADPAAGDIGYYLTMSILDIDLEG
ncbi:MAG TPA: DUF3126 family protein [Caulobacterales bacterium]|nr:DUF3126 family protein [Caulobacterales bacterium]